MLINNSNVLIQSEDRSCEQERLRHVIEQPTRYVIDLDHLICHQRDTAHDEQYRTGVLRDFEAFVFHGLRQCSMVNVQWSARPKDACYQRDARMFNLLHRASSSPTQQQGDDVTDHLKDLLNRLAHNCNVLNGE